MPCDVPAMVRRRELPLTVSTGGSVPALSAALRAWPEDAFGEECAGRLARVAAARAELRATDASPPEVMRAVRASGPGGWLSEGRQGAGSPR